MTPCHAVYGGAVSRPEEPSDTDEVWREIVANFGERASLDETPATESPQTAEPGHQPESEPEPVLPAWLEDEGGFVPPDPPKVPRPRTWQRGVAWSGVLVAPALALLLVLASVHVPTVVGWGLVLWCLGGFGYLVATMPRTPGDPWDDGSRV